MVKRTKRGSIPKDEVLDKLEIGRKGAIQMCARAKVPSPEYQAAHEVTEAIDRVATLLTGDETYFHIGSSTGSIT